MERADLDTLLRFKSITGFNIERFFNRVVLFLQEDYALIEAFYIGNSKSIPETEIDEMNIIVSQLDEIYDLIELHSRSFSNIRFVSLVTQIEQLDSTFKNIKNLVKWNRSSSVNGEFSKEIQFTSFLRQGETVEQFSLSRLDRDDYQDAWFDISIENKQLERDYELEGGQLLQVKFNNTQQSIDAVAGLIEGESIYGKDISKEFIYENDDIRTVDKKQCFEQSCNILLRLRKGDNPDDLSRGLNKKVIAGTNINSINYPLILRQLIQTFATDDTIDSISITNSVRKQDALNIELEIIGRLGDIKSSNFIS